MDLTYPESVKRTVGSFAPDIVIHCAAYTAVDRAEEEQERCYAVNAVGTQTLAECCRECGAKLIYISTDYVFSGQGDQPYETGDETGPLNVYGQTKLEGERAVRALVSKSFIVRTSWVFGVNGRNFVRTMLELGEHESSVRITGDQYGSPTYTRDLAGLVCDMALSEKYGVYHATNEGICTWAEFAAEIFRQAGMKVQVMPRAAGERHEKALRPCNSRLSKRCLDDNGFARLPPWQDALGRYLKEIEKLDESGFKRRQIGRMH